MIFLKFLEVRYKKNRFEVVMVVVVAEVVDNKLVKEFNGGLVKFYLSKVKQIKFEVVVYGVVDQEVTKVVE